MAGTADGELLGNESVGESTFGKSDNIGDGPRVDPTTSDGDGANTVGFVDGASCAPAVGGELGIELRSPVEETGNRLGDEMTEDLSVGCTEGAVGTRDCEDVRSFVILEGESGEVSMALTEGAKLGKGVAVGEESRPPVATRYCRNKSWPE